MQISEKYQILRKLLIIIIIIIIVMFSCLI